MSKNCAQKLAPRHLLLTALSEAGDLYLAVSADQDVLILTTAGRTLRLLYHARWPAHTFGEPVALVWVGSLPVIASQKGLLLCIDIADRLKVSCLEGFRGSGIAALASARDGELLVLEHSGLLRFFDVCKDPLLSWKVANERQHQLHFRLEQGENFFRQNFIKMTQIGRWCVLVTSADALLLLDCDALKKRWSVAIDSAMLPVTVLATDGRWETRASSNVNYKVLHPADALVDAVVALDKAGHVAYVAFLTWERTVVVCRIKTPAAQRKPAPDLSAPRRKEPSSTPEVVVQRFESAGINTLPRQLGVLDANRLWIQRADANLLVFGDLSLGLIHKTVAPCSAVEAFSALEATPVSGEFLILGMNGLVRGYDLEHGSSALAKSN